MTNWENIDKAGTFEGGYTFNKSGMVFNQLLDNETGNTVFFNGAGLGQIWTNENKTS